MEIVSIVLILLVAVVVSGAISRMLPIALPTPLVQIALGSIIGLAANLRVELDPELFLLLFLPPLLFLDGWRIPKDELLKDVSTVFELALGLVLLTVIGVGFFIHWLVPAMPLAVAFALAAVVSPTDPIAVSAIGSLDPRSSGGTVSPIRAMPPVRFWRLPPATPSTPWRAGRFVLSCGPKNFINRNITGHGIDSQPLKPTKGL